MWNPFKKPPPPPPEPVSLGEEAIALFIVVGLAWLIKKIRDEKHLDITSMLHYVGDMCEVATYSFCYFLFAMYFGGVVEDIMPHYANTRRTGVCGSRCSARLCSTASSAR